jgi:excisionase family DNA binding protein
MLDRMTDPQESRKEYTLAEVRDLATIRVAHESLPNAASVLRISRDLAYDMARRGELPTIRLGNRLRVPVPALLKMLGE